MLAQEKQICLTSNCTKITTHESGICHLHRKRRVNADGEIEWCFPANCYFKTDTKLTIADYCLIPKVRTKKRAAPIKCFADLGILLKTALADEQRICDQNNNQMAVQPPKIDPPQQIHEDVTLKNYDSKIHNGFWGRLVRIFVTPNTNTV